MSRFVALAGGVGAARFLRGLVRVVAPEDLTIVGNTGDDDEFHGLWVSPDLDTVTYTLAGAVGQGGWGLADDTFRALSALDRYGEPTWFRLGDADLATHLHRTAQLRRGATLSEVTGGVARAWGLKSRLVPMSDDRVATRFEVSMAGSDDAVGLSMQEWFVRDRFEPPVKSVRFEGAGDARPAPGVLEALAGAEAVFVCPSNPVISIGPILAVPGIRPALARRRERVVAVSPIIKGAAVRGPADRLMAASGLEVSCAGVAAAYADICGTLLIDGADADRATDVAGAGVRPVVAATFMADVAGAERLGRAALDALG
ncbi:MAG: 2-phospho-L-lactate transferase [Acidimicrobiia bacterium]